MTITKEEFEAWDRRASEKLSRHYGSVIEFMGSPEFHAGKTEYDDPETEKAAREKALREEIARREDYGT
jgi:hypothetical protein